MIGSISSALAGGRAPLHALTLMLITLLLTLLYYYWSPSQISSVVLQATATTESGLTFPYEVVHSEMSVDWDGGGDFDPRGKCPDGFFKAGFQLVCKKLADGTSTKFLYHKGKKLLYRIDKDVINGKVLIGLHWVVSTHFNAKYRIADNTYKPSRAVPTPNAKGGTDLQQFKYGEAVSKKRVRPGRELFRETHINAKQCTSWLDIFNFMP